MTEYQLQDYGHNVLHRVSPNGPSGEDRIQSTPSNETRDLWPLTDGYGAWMKMGLWPNRRKLFAALFTDGNTLWLKYGDKLIDCLSRPIAVTRENRWIGIKRFRVEIGGQCIIDDKYIWLDVSEWPDNGDILSHMARILKSRRSMMFIILFRNAAKRGLPEDVGRLANELHLEAERLAAK